MKKYNKSKEDLCDKIDRILKLNPMDDIKCNVLNNFITCCEDGDKKTAELLYESSKIGNMTIDINYDNNDVFMLSCYNDHKDVAEWLYNLSKANGKKIDFNELGRDFEENCLFSV